MDNRHLGLGRRDPHIEDKRRSYKGNQKVLLGKRLVQVDTPIFTGAIGESAGNLFEIDYFDYGKVYLKDWTTLP